MTALVRRIRLWWKQQHCEHHLRPCRLEPYYGGRKHYEFAAICDYCGLVKAMSEERFYAQFGIIRVKL